MKRAGRPRGASSGTPNRPQNRTTVVARYEGPLPTAGQLEKYETVLPGAAERIVSMAEAEHQNRHFLEKVGLIGGLLVWFALLVAAVLLAHYGARTAAAVVGSGVGLMMLDRFIKRRVK
ncbi:MAG: DUF2335 domain-containing protein [Acidobacteria bacterium]|nr:DUF2335 domain-containing protein [Acidobacteriota bacterium]MXW37413.1 DUF2335 domain-containing protein [Acidobacteriota bacterium]MYA45896.1 DUF2335 domain-containing protein [Acidobacteriota bacterium]MYI39960.1 DUF2335 domain-containing protein [Acidobacteriota bacterium]